jgi:hypothetical protein
MKKNRPKKYLQNLKIKSSEVESNLKSQFRHRDRGIHAGRVRGK